MREMMRAFVSAYSPGQWMLLFYLCCFAGWCWEVSLYLIREKRFVNRGFLSGPFLPIYGFGALLVLFVCLPLKEHPLLVALAGTLAASVLEYLTGEAMEALFHVRYWDYSKQKWNLRGHICLLSVATWAVMSFLITCVIHPMLQQLLWRVPDRIAFACAGALTVFAGTDAVLSVRRALDLRALLESMETYAKEFEAICGGLDSITDRVGDLLRDFVQDIEVRQDALEEKLARIDAARDSAVAAIREKRLNAEEAVKERFAEYERVLGEITADLPGIGLLREEINETRERLDRQSEKLRDARMLGRMKKAQRMLRRNPGAMSVRHQQPFSRLISSEEPEKKK